jgi:HEAT repeat protein
MAIIRPFTKLVGFFAVTIILASTTLQTAEGQATASEQENELLAVLQSDAAPAEKAVTCKRLAIYGSDAAVPELAKLLSDPQLASWSRIALEAIPGPTADRALRESLDSLEGTLLVGAINSIGVRRIAEAVDQLSDLLQHEDTGVASAAAVALGQIGNAPATKSLRTALASAPVKVRSAVAEGCVLCAERLHASGESEAATEIYDQVRAADVPTQRIIEATRGAILARDQEGIPLLLETLRSPEKEMFQLALGTIREFPGSEVDEVLAAELTSATPARAALIVQAMADRPDTVVLAAVLKAAGEGNNQVRISAIDALRRVGDQSCLAVLLQTATEDDGELASAAKATLAGLPGAKIDKEIASMLPNASDNLQPLLLHLIGQRRINAVDDVVAALGHSDPEIRSAALYALGETVALDDLPVLISQVISPKHPDDAESAQQALMVASVRMPDRDKCTTELVKAMNQAPSGTKTTLLEIVGAVGGSAALNALAEAAKSDDPELQDASSRLLGKWNSVDAAPVLLDLAKTAPAERFRIRALRGYLGIARKFPMPEPQRVEMCQKAMDASSRLEEQQLALEVLKIHPSQAGLNLAVQAQEIPQLKNEATATAQAISKELGR